ncbi:MAG: hypothetical protein EON60_12985 [Alphaproteobacteria bacterium]|nr:MAG: hypothetical protein EON60_12985 [Alphaproteobacteria bacterium]
MLARELTLPEMMMLMRDLMRIARLMQRADDLREHMAQLRKVRLMIWLDKHEAETDSARYTANEDRLTRLILAEW